MNIYVGNMSADTTEDNLRQAFESFGQVTNVNIVRDKTTGQSRGFGFVNMPTEAEGKAAVAQLNGSDLNGSKINAEEARSKPTAPSFANAGRRGSTHNRSHPGDDKRRGGFRGGRGDRGGRPRY